MEIQIRIWKDFDQIMKNKPPNNNWCWLAICHLVWSQMMDRQTERRKLQKQQIILSFASIFQTQKQFSTSKIVAKK